ncbi:hypothetical protein CHO01_11120 [Cellulomonas hominis]|uniref:Lipoprotein n=1 Tax=Cellulomonas hominis TaxID=156981 RepID=A0A511F9R2_9CELL|nr:hypothetical protein [Cellulomonas hominis]MBB5473542.1 hypothetical protein [Cellulomonas hominis]NKY12038.1 hypothetical protein [Cellulomonas hominis]GEL45996.1 hypothetical protein CHO01_11120 [Cellulomonas hominis]
MRRVRCGIAAAVVLAGLVGCGTDPGDPAARQADTAAAAQPADSAEEPVAQTPDPAPAPSYALCAEFPGGGGALPGDAESWWNNTPANPDGSVVRDPEQWPAPMREHPRVATVEVDTGTVISLYDRTTCRQDPAGYQPPPAGPGWEPGGYVALDADTGELLSSWQPYVG